MNTKTCSIEGCDSEGRLKSFCRKHYNRDYKRSHSEQNRATTRNHYYTRSENPTFVRPTAEVPIKELSYTNAHKATRLLRGKPSLYECICGKPAAQWAFNHSDNKHTRLELVNGYELVFSINPFDYLALCGKCHKQFDMTGLLMHDMEEAA